uniref:Ovule protein n=1 Tax=Rodentolepis nana TaxID=102285 RepID=A0A0R3U0Q7_RODNA
LSKLLVLVLATSHWLGTRLISQILLKSVSMVSFLLDPF